MLQYYTELLKKVSELKLWLAQKEVIEYSNWKNNNATDRTAMDKVVANLKLADDKWLGKEQEYEALSADLAGKRMVLDIYKNMLVSDKIDKEELQTFSKFWGI